MRNAVIYLFCITVCLDQAIGSKFLAPLIIRSPNVTYRVTLLSERPTEVKVRRPGSLQDNTFNVAYTRPLQLEVPSAVANANSNFSQSFSSLDLTSDGSTVAFLSSEGTADVSVTSLISSDADSISFVIPYFVTKTGAALGITGGGFIDIYLVNEKVKANKLSSSRSVTVRNVPTADVTGYRVETSDPAAVYVDLPCLVSPHQAGVCGTAHIPVPPIARLGYDHVIPRPPGKHYNIAYRVVAALTNTHVLVWDQLNEWSRVASLRVGEFYDGVSTSGLGSISIQCDEPCSVTQILSTNTTYNFKALEVVPDLTKSKRTVIFELDTLPQGDVHYVKVLTLTIHQRALLFNGIPLGGAKWTVLPSWSDWSLASFPIPEGNHNISSIHGMAPILAWHYATYNEEVITLGSITGFGCQDHLCMRRNEDGDCVSCREGLVLQSGKCTAPEISVKVGENVTLPCFFASSQTTNVITWYRQPDVSVCGYEKQDSRKQVASFSSTGIKSIDPVFGTRTDLETSSGNLEINDVTIRDQGFYTCLSYGSIMLRVQVKLSVFLLPDEILTSWSVMGDEVMDFKLKLTCDVKRVSPQPSEFYWLLTDGSQVGSSAFSNNPDSTFEAEVTYVMDKPHDVNGLKCVMVVGDRQVVQLLPLDSGLRLLLVALKIPMATNLTEKKERQEKTETEIDEKETDVTMEEKRAEDEKTEHFNIGTMIGAAIGGVVVLLLIALLIFLILCARGMVKSQMPPESPSLNSVGYCIRSCGCPQATINGAGPSGFCSPVGMAPRPSCSSEYVSSSRRELLVCLENDYDSCELKNEESIVTATTCNIATTSS